MCVILICPPRVRPSFQTLRDCAKANPHGAGLAWREKRRIHWRKDLSAGEVNRQLQHVTGELIIHFRWASVGGVDPLLCHPFPVTGKAELALWGASDAVLFHNGTWSGYPDLGLDGPVSDSRTAAALIHRDGTKFLRSAPGRWAIMRRREIDLFGEWLEWKGMWCSNLNFLSKPSPRPFREPQRGFTAQQTSFLDGEEDGVQS